MAFTIAASHGNDSAGAESAVGVPKCRAWTKNGGRGVHRRANGELFREVAGYVDRPAGRCPYNSATNGKNVGLALGPIANNSAQDVHRAVDADRGKEGRAPGGE